MFDFGVAIFGLAVASPVLLAIATAIKLTSRGPVLYAGVRVGRDNRRFRILKFRTMVVDAEASGTTTALGDPRITRIGRALRRYKLDELPQLVNVLRGEMSVVGPRPEVQEHADAYTPEERAILSVTPGITDYSSIHFVSLDEALGSDNPHDVFVTRFRAEKNRLRLDYVRRRSFVEDLRIVGLTISAIGRKAFGKKAP